MTVLTAAAFFAGVAIGGVIVHLWHHPEISFLDASMRLAYKENGKLSRIIGRQRLKINELKALLPPKPKAIAVQKPTQPVSH